MAKAEFSLKGNYGQIIGKITDEILAASPSATLEEKSDFTSGDAKCSVRIFERYSYFGGNRLTLSLTFFKGESDVIRLSAVTSGGSQAVLFKVNTFGEQNFLNLLTDIVEKLGYKL